MSHRFIRRKTVEQKTGLGRAQIYENMARGTFPRPVRIGERAVAWVEAEIDEWQKARVAERDGSFVAASVLQVCAEEIQARNKLV
jgi:prophage regulatory protein